MNIDVSTKVTTSNVSVSSSQKAQNDDSVKFSSELSNLSKNDKNNSCNEQVEDIKGENTKEKKDTKVSEEKVSNEEKDDMNNVINGLENIVAEMDNKINQKDEIDATEIKDIYINDDKNNKNEAQNLINNDMNIQERKDDIAFQMNANMNFNSNGQPFSDFMESQSDKKLSNSVADLKEEQAILSTMDENLAIANRNRVLAEEQKNKQVSNVKTVINNEGIKKVNKESNVTIETVVKFDDIAMNENDVDFFVKLVEQGQIEASQASSKSAKVSQTLADMIAKSMKDNQPVRIDFDNNISVIIKVGKDGKISADFLPSSQVAEAYLKENLPLLKQRFDENNIEYDELNQRQQRQNEKDDKKKGRKDE